MVATVTPPAAICFDLDETLLDGSGLELSIIRACEEIARRRPDLSAEELLAANAAAWQQYWAEAERDWIIGSLDGASLGREAWRRTLLVCGCGDESLVEFATATHLRLARDAHRIFDDAPAAMAAVREREISVALVTNGAADTQRDKLEALGIEHWFETIVVSGEIGAAKPDVTPFRAALAAIGVEADDAWHVGDSLVTDVAGANAAGLTSVWLNRHGHRRRNTDAVPDVEVRTLGHLVDLLASPQPGAGPPPTPTNGPGRQI